MASLPAQVIYQLIINHMVPLLASSVAGLSSSYFSRQQASPTLVRHDVNEEHELDMLHMDRLLPWMRIMFDEPEKEHLEARQAYKNELYSVYTTIRTDYTQYQQWKQYNGRIWVFSSYRKKDTLSLAKKILADIRLFQEGLKMFSMWGHFVETRASPHPSPYGAVHHSTSPHGAVHHSTSPYGAMHDSTPPMGDVSRTPSPYGAMNHSTPSMGDA